MRAGFLIGGERHAPPASAAELLARLRAALAAAPRPQPEIAGVPLAGGLVGFAAYDVVRYFERLPARRAAIAGVPALHYVAPRSLLVFDHLTRGIALLHAGSEEERRALRTRSDAGACAVRCRKCAAPAATRRRAPPTRAPTISPAYGARRSTSPPATSTSWCSPAASPAATSSIPSRRTARCG